jgi:glycosyltransferase involved in cell wall biosynthesis
MTAARQVPRVSIRHLREVAHHRLVVPRIRRALPSAVAARDAREVARLLQRVTRTRAGHAAERGRGGRGGHDPAGQPVVDVILLAKSGLTADLDAAFADDASVRVWLLEREWVKAIASDLLGPGVSDYDYLGRGEDHERRRRDYRAFLVEVLRHYLPAVGATTMLTGNFVYWAERELGPALREVGGRLIVLHKEALLAAWPLTAHAYRRAVQAGVGAFEGDAIGVYTADMGRLLVDIGVVTPERVHVVGTPRIDDGHAHRRAGRPGARRDRVTLFTFPTWRGLTFPFDPDPEPLPVGLEQGWQRLLEDTVEAIITLAERRPDLDVVAKVKAGGEDDEATARLRAAADASRRSGAGNLRLVVAGEGGELILTSHVIVAFNSTVIPEAIAAGTAVVVPAYGEAALVTASGGTLELGAGAGAGPDAGPASGARVVAAASPEELIDAIERLVDADATGDGAAPSQPGGLQRGRDGGTDLDAAALELLERLAGNADGRAGERLRALVLGGRG